ncbi:hypothetical protein [Empedobacter brevis]|uniref:hypothetical protein n=1 Tax=Empedobacter brevis TaxID=247 RepID=UPI0023F0CD20|nr:hypothetical protein [Empedobacter brevis]
MANNFRYQIPTRTFTKTYKIYRSYKIPLAKDFNYRCGYTDCPDFWFGGKNTFHIDHFRPFSKNPALETEYSNLVYCCSYVNILKSDDEGDYLDPCNADFNSHFERDNDGRIVPKAESIEANYMFSKLKLNLRRYSLIWKLDEMFEKMKKLRNQINNPINAAIKNDLKILHSDLAEEFTTYLEYLKAEQ